MTRRGRDMVMTALLLLVLCLPTIAQTSSHSLPRLTLDEAIRTALREHPDVRQARAALEAARARTAQARADYFPHIDVSGFGKQGLSGASGALGLSGLVTSPLFRDLGASAALFQNIYDFGRTAHQVKASRWAAISLEHALEAQRAWVTLNVERAYYRALQAQRLVEVGRKVLQERRLTARQAAAFHRAELTSKVDVTLAEANVAQAELDLMRAEEQLATAFAELNHAMGIIGQPTYQLEEPEIVIEPLPDLAALLDEAERRRPDLLALKAQIRVDEQIVARARSERRPRFVGLWSGGWVRFSTYSIGRLMLGALGVYVPMFTGGQVKNRIKEAQARLEQTRAAYEKLAQDVRLQVQRAYRALMTARKSISVNERLVERAREARRLAQLRYRAQLSSFVELLSAEAEAARAEAAYAESRYAYKIAQALLRYAAGRAPRR